MQALQYPVAYHNATSPGLNTAEASRRRTVADASLRNTAIRGLAAFDDEKTPDLILKNYADFDTPTKVDAAASLPAGMIERIVRAPVLLLVAVDLRVVASFDSLLPRVGVISGASIYPFVWNILLAARNEGLGGTLTTFVAPAEAEVRRLFSLPDHYAVSALLPIGKPVKQLSKLKRKRVEEFTTVDAYTGPPLNGPAKG